MTAGPARDLRSLQGRRVAVALTDRSCIDSAVLEGVTDENLWLHAEGVDVFVPVGDVLDVWEVRP